ASADMMLDLIIGKSTKEAKRLSELFMRMIRGETTEEELEELEEAGALRDIAHMPARVKCAVLGWRTMDELLKG
ncbi:MAG: SUF system NifU family Fe-S cluster assembly protein, partial [Clostridiales bacterium]|nr:SUF system NifU family Fe-S cluster assembly protein [Clostridiales bacterium]